MPPRGALAILAAETLDGGGVGAILEPDAFVVRPSRDGDDAAGSFRGPARGGHRADAALRQAEQRNSHGDDADAYYFRAEIRQRVDPAGALADLDRYEAIMTRNLASGAFGDANKAGCLAGMRAR